MPITVQAQIYKCVRADQSVVYSDKKCSSKETRVSLRITDSVMDGIGSTRDADAAALWRERLANSAAMRVTTDETLPDSWQDAAPQPNDDSTFTIYSPFLGPGMIMKQF